jgi:predicted RNA methylase
MNQTIIDPQELKYIHAWHYDMLINQERSQFYNDLIKDHCRDKIVLEIGTGSGLLAALAIKHGAKKVICCEENPLLAFAARQLFKRLGIEDRIQLIAMKSNDIATSEIPPVDVVLHELFASDPFGEEFIPTLKDARRFMAPDGIFLPDSIQIIYQPIRANHLPEKLYFGDIELIEMSQLLSQVHPSLRVRDRADTVSEIFSLPAVKISDLLDTPYSYTEKNDKLVDVDAVEVSFLIIHENKKFQAAQFQATEGRIHWYSLVFYKLDVHSNQLKFAVKDQVKLTVG